MKTDVATIADPREVHCFTKQIVRIPDRLPIDVSDEDLRRIRAAHAAGQDAPTICRVMTPEDGDKRLTWDPNSKEEVFDAKELWEQLIKEGMDPYRVDQKTGKVTAEKLKIFYAKLGEVVFLPVRAMVGG